MFNYLIIHTFSDILPILCLLRMLFIHILIQFGITKELPIKLCSVFLHMYVNLKIILMELNDNHVTVRYTNLALKLRKRISLFHELEFSNFKLVLH